MINKTHDIANLVKVSFLTLIKVILMFRCSELSSSVVIELQFSLMTCHSRKAFSSTWMCRLLLQITHTHRYHYSKLVFWFVTSWGRREGRLFIVSWGSKSFFAPNIIRLYFEWQQKPWKTLAMALGCLFVSIFMIQATFCVAVRSNGALITLATLYYCCTIRTLRNGKT